MKSVELETSFGALGNVELEVEYESDDGEVLLSGIWLFMDGKSIDLLGVSDTLDDLAFKAAYEAAQYDVRAERDYLIKAFKEAA
jgi:hypothetical protein